MHIMAFTITPTEPTTPGGIISGGILGGTIAGSIKGKHSHGSTLSSQIRRVCAILLVIVVVFNPVLFLANSAVSPSSVLLSVNLGLVHLRSPVWFTIFNNARFTNLAIRHSIETYDCHR